jgi:hypothetical protein
VYRETETTYSVYKDAKKTHQIELQKLRYYLLPETEPLVVDVKQHCFFVLLIFVPFFFKCMIVVNSLLFSIR